MADLTDEELARIETILHEWFDGDTHTVWLINRLIADLRASRAEVDRLKGFLDDTDRKRYEAEVYADWKSRQ